MPPGLNVSSEKYKAGKGMYFDGNRYEFSIGQSVSTDASVVFGNVDVPNGTVTANAIKVGGITATGIITAPEFVGDVKWGNITDTESSNVTFNVVYADKFYDSLSFEIYDVLKTIGEYKGENKIQREDKNTKGG